jgi:O-antigen ligase
MPSSPGALDRTLERLSRLVPLVSLLAAGAAHAYLMSRTIPELPWVAAGLFAVSVSLTRLSLVFALLPALLTAYATPALMMVAVGEAGAHDPLVWLSLLAGPLVASSDWSRWHTPRLWTPLLAMWALVIGVTWPIIAGREIDFSLLAAATFDTPNGLLAPPPPLAAAAVTGAAMGQLIGILWIDLLWQRFGSDRVARLERWILTPLVVSIIAGSTAGLYQRYVDPTWLSYGPWSPMGRSGSLMLDANSFGMAAALWAPLAIVLSRRLGRLLVFGLVAAAVLVAGVWTSGSRTALAVLVTGLLGLFAASIVYSRGWKARLAITMALAASVVAGGVVGNQAAGPNPIQRLIENIPTAEAGGASRIAQTLWERDGYGTASVQAISEHPATGVGVGSFNHIAGDFSYRSAGAVVPPDNAQNWWRQQVVEFGFLGAAPSVTFSFLVLLIVVLAPAPADRRWSALVLRAVLLGIGLVCLVAVPTQHPALWLTVLTVVFWLSAMTSQSVLVSTGEGLRWVWTGVVALPLVVAAGQLQTATTDLRVPVRAVRAGFPYAYGFTAPDGDKVPWMGRRAIVVIPVQHAYFSWTAEGPHLVDPVRVRLWRGQTPIGEVEVSRTQPVTRIIAVPSGAKLFTLEAAITGTLPAGRGLKITGQWLREIPPGTPADSVIP